MNELWMQHSDINLHYSVLLGIEFFGMRRGLDQHSDDLLDVSLCLMICTLHRSLEGTVQGVGHEWDM